MSLHSDTNSTYTPDPRLSKAYEEATSLDRELFASLCPEYLDLEEGSDRYTEQTLIGEGSLKQVYKAYDQQTKRWVALARLKKERGVQYYDDFVREARLIASLNHPNIIKIYEIGIDEDERPYFTMDLKSGDTLSKVIKTGKLSRKELITTFLKVCDAIAYAHSKGVLHLDIKPDNIQSNSYGEVLVCDWGLGLQLSPTETQDEAEFDPVEVQGTQTLVGRIAGSPGYMAPEQTIPDSEKDERTDIFALGAVFYTLLTGHAPFKGEKEAILRDTQLSKVEEPRQRYPKLKIPRSLNAIAMKALAKDPNSRYRNVEALQDDLYNYQAGYTTSAENSGFFRETKLFLRRNLLPASISLTALIICTIGSVFFLRDLEKTEMKAEAQRMRAEALLSTVDELYADYSTLEESTVATNEGLSSRLAQASNRLKNYGIFDQPIETLAQAEDLAKIAISLDPDNQGAIRQLYAAHCLTLNYKAALALQGDRDGDRGYHEFVHAFPAYQFSATHPASAEELLAIIDIAKNSNQSFRAHLERVIVYQTAIERNMKGLDRVLLAYIDYLNGKGNTRLDYDQASQAAHLYSDRALQLRCTISGGSNLCILRLLPINELKLSIKAPFDLRNLEGLPIESLDLSDCGKVTLNTELNLNQLKRLTLRAGQLSPGNLRRFLATPVGLYVIVIEKDAQF